MVNSGRMALQCFLQERDTMHQWENDFLNFENELLLTRKKLNDLIYEYQHRDQNLQNNVIYQDKLRYLEVELQYINNQLQLLKRAQSEGVNANVQAQNMVGAFVNNATAPVNMAEKTVPIETVTTQNEQNSAMQTPMTQNPMVQTPVTQNLVVNQQTQKAANPYPAVSYSNMGRNTAPTTPVKSPRTTQDYEKLFGKNLMGIFASVLIFISLIIFATLILPHLTDTLKMLAMYIAGFAVLSAGLLLHRKNRENLFYIAIIGCGVGSLYLSLLLSNLYFKMIGDLVLYALILAWAIFVKYLTKIKHYVFTIIGQAGILIASILGTALCVHEADPQKFFVLSIFYFISAVVFSNIGRNYLQALVRSSINGVTEEEIRANIQASDENQSGYEHNLCTHICKTLNVIVYTVGFALMTDSVYIDAAYPGPSFLIVANILLFMGYLLLEFFFSYKEKCSNGLAFQILSMVNAVLLVFLFHETKLLEKDWSFAFVYLVAVAALLYVEKKDAAYKLFSQLWCFVLLFIGCINNPWMKDHLYAYLTVVPFMLYGKWKKDIIYLGAGVVYLTGLPLFIWSTYRMNSIESLIMLTILYGAFLYTSRKTDQTWFKIAGYIVLCFTTMRLVYDISYNETVRTNPGLITFFVLAVIHLILNKLEYFGKEKATEGVMLGINALLMLAGCGFMNASDEILWKLPVILIAVLLFLANSEKLLPKHKYMGYYIAFKYTVLMLCILGSFDVVNYAVSICLLVFAIISIIAGFYKDMVTFRLYGLILSMISIVKLIMIDIKYDSTVETAVSFFVSGVLCFVISFIYNRIDSRLRGK